MAPDHGAYHPKDTVKNTVNALMVTGAAGFGVSAVQNSLAKKNYGPWGVFTRMGGTMVTFTIAGGAFAFIRDGAANLREKEDSLNPALGGFFAGAVLGLRSGTTPTVLGLGAVTAVLMGAYDFTGGSLTGYKKDKEVDEFERKEALRKNRRIPIEQTISEIGEGRGIYASGYDERRKERIKEKYGIDVPAKSTH